ncbi:MAG: hypothetical protein U9N36_10905 [Euryarchaeota archaeon]|nr:hypothetical protein [Euryarchaeota archaeon]
MKFLADECVDRQIVDRLMHSRDVSDLDVSDCMIVDGWNESNSRLKVELWEHWKLEQLLASHPYIIKLYGLR